MLLRCSCCKRYIETNANSARLWIFVGTWTEEPSEIVLHHKVHYFYIFSFAPLKSMHRSFMFQVYFMTKQFTSEIMQTTALIKPLRHTNSSWGLKCADHVPYYDEREQEHFKNISSFSQPSVSFEKVQRDVIEKKRDRATTCVPRYLTLCSHRLSCINSSCCIGLYTGRIQKNYFHKWAEIHLLGVTFL